MRYGLFFVLALSCASAEAEVIFSDDFEHGISPLWSLVVGPEAPVPSGQSPKFLTTQNLVHHGNQAVTTNSYSLVLNRNLGFAQTNTTYEAWIYDTGFSNQESLIAVSTDTNSSSLTAVWAGVEGSRSTSKYVVGQGPTVLTTTVDRSIGWHLFQIYDNGTSNTVYIDNQNAVSTPFQSAFSDIWLWANNTETPTLANYHPGSWDDVNVYQGTPISGALLQHGDFDRNLHVDRFDVPAMLQALSNIPAYKTANGFSDSDMVFLGDFNASGALNNLDVQAFLNFLKAGGGSIAAVPEPASLTLLALGGALMWRRRLTSDDD